MKNIRPVVQGFILCACLVASFVATAEQQSIVVDSNGDYVFTYEGYRGWQEVKWIPATKINPSVKGVVQSVEGKPDSLSYRYTLRNGKDSRQFLLGMRLLASNVLSTDPMTPAGWTGHITLNHTAGSGFIVGCSFRRYDGPWEAGIKPGNIQSGFGFDSKDLPGIGKISLWGASPAGQSFPDQGPNPDSPIREEFLRIQSNNFVTRLAAVPRIAVPSPFDAAEVLSGIQKHLKDDLVPMKLVEPAFADNFNRLLDTAIEAAKRGNNAGLRANLKDLRQMLKGFGEPGEGDHAATQDEIPDDQINTKLWPHPVAKLAARVLDFDLEFVEKRIKS